MNKVNVLFALIMVVSLAVMVGAETVGKPGAGEGSACGSYDSGAVARTCGATQDPNTINCGGDAY